MNTVIRKISVGKEYPNGSIHYQVGSIQNLKGSRYEIVSITLDKELMQVTGNLAYNIFIKDAPRDSSVPTSVQLWKTISGVPVVIENNIDLE